MKKFLDNEIAKIDFEIESVAGKRVVDVIHRQNAFYSLGCDITFGLGIVPELGLLIGKKLVDSRGNKIIR